MHMHASYDGIICNYVQWICYTREMNAIDTKKSDKDKEGDANLDKVTMYKKIKKYAKPKYWYNWLNETIRKQRSISRLQIIIYTSKTSWYG